MKPVQHEKLRTWNPRIRLEGSGRKLAPLLAVGIVLGSIGLPFAALAETYQFIVSGYPAANESYSTRSSGTSLETATRSDKSAASPIEARFRTWDESDGIALRSDKYRATMIIFR